MVAVSDLPNRKSMKFRHGTEPHVAECTVCHINITKSATLRGLTPDVPIAPACSECHNKAPSHLEISNELAAIDKNRDFVCVYCHTSDVGRRDPPASHYLSAERPPIKRKDVK
jgi:predicted CXXCH cytochrome family protein